MDVIDKIKQDFDINKDEIIANNGFCIFLPRFYNIKFLDIVKEKLTEFGIVFTEQPLSYGIFIPETGIAFISDINAVEKQN